MNSALRIANILKKIQSSKETIALKIFEEVFEVKGCIRVVQKLRLCNTQIDILKEKSHKSLISFLQSLFGCEAIQRNIQNEKSNIAHYIMALETAGAYMPLEKIDHKSITELSELLEQMRSKIELSGTQEHYKKILNSYVEELSEGLVDIDIGGIEAFISKVEIANGKVVLYNQAFSDNEMMKIVNKIYEISTKILNDAQIWSGALGWISGRFLS